MFINKKPREALSVDYLMDDEDDDDPKIKDP